MPRRTKPRSGSLQYWPRRRAKRIYPRVSHWGDSKEVKPMGFAGWKVGMMHVQLVDSNPKSVTSGKIVTKPATVLDAPPVFVCGMRFYKKTHNGMMSIGEKWTDKIPKEIEIKRKTLPGKGKEAENYDDIRLIVATQPAKSGMRKKKPEIFELGIGGDTRKKFEYANSVFGKEIMVQDIIKPGEYVDVSGVTKGHGFSGPVKRYGIRIQTRKDKQMHRHVGSIGSTVPRKVDWRVPQAGQHGFHVRTDFSKRILMIDTDAKKIIPKSGFTGYGIPKSFVLVEGSVPGSRKRLVILRKSVRTKKVVQADVKYISTESKIGA